MHGINIELHDVSKNYQNQMVLNSISNTFEAGKIHGLVGKNGSGKTVLLKCICGLTSVSSGEIKFIAGGDGITTRPGIGVIIETPGFIPNISGFKNLLYLARLTNSVSKEQIIAAMDAVGLNPKSKQPVSKYSLGMRQRLGVAQAIMEDPPIILLDEPLNGLDSVGSTIVKELLLKERNNGKTIIIASHCIDDVQFLCDTVHKIEDGELYQVDANNIGNYFHI
jgi:ABC-2 type transport system ATP-binding protein